MPSVAATPFRRTRPARLLASALALVALGACNRDSTSGPLTPVTSRFEGTVTATETHTPSGTDVAIHVTGNGTGSYVGRFTLVDDLAASLVTLQGSSTMVLTTEKRDRITATATVQATPANGGAALTVVETATVTGGTGRFAGATGSFTLTRLVDLTQGTPYPSTGSISEGSITHVR